MIVRDRTSLMLLKLTNPEDFQLGESYWHNDKHFEFEGFLKDEEQFEGYSGEPYGDEAYYMIHSVFSPGEEFDFRYTDESVAVSHPWVLIVSGDHTMLCIFMRFQSYTDMCAWLDNPFDTRIFYVF